jgi:hypothetical protein
MADEIKTFVRLTLATTNDFTRTFSPPQTAYTQSNPEAYENTVSLTTTDAKLTISNTSSYGYAYFQNISNSTAAVVHVGSDSTAVLRGFTRLAHKQWCVGPLIPNTTYRAQMSTTNGGLLLYGVWGS